MSSEYAYIKSHGQTDVGQLRQNNEDSLGFDNTQGWFAVADGMGGEDAGEIASAQVIHSLRDELAKMPDQEGVDNLHTKRLLIERGLVKANQAIRAFVSENGLHQSGSTAVMMAFDFCQPDRALIAHAGDSRVYRMRNGSLHQLTVDHSVAAAAGLDNEEDIPAIFRGMITRAVGIKETVEAEFQITDVQIGDVYLICSDGLNGMINDCEIAERLNGITSEQLPSAANLLIADANAKGGRDNISVILIHIGKSKASSSNREHLTRLEPASHEGDACDPIHCKRRQSAHDLEYRSEANSFARCHESTYGNPFNRRSLAFGPFRYRDTWNHLLLDIYRNYEGGCRDWNRKLSKGTRPLLIRNY